MSAKKPPSLPAALAAPAVALLLLIGAAFTLASRHPQEATDYHDRIRREAVKLPLLVGGWYARDVPVAAPAIRLLQPNVLISRHYVNLQSGQSVTVMIVQCPDAYDMVYHYPPNCFRHNGWERQWTQQRTWTVADKPVPLMEYGFTRERFNGVEEVTVGNFIVLSSGLELDMPAIEVAARDPMRRPFGAAQIQLVYDAKITEENRRQIFEEILPAYLPIIRAITTPDAAAPGTPGSAPGTPGATP